MTLDEVMVITKKLGLSPGNPLPQKENAQVFHVVSVFEAYFHFQELIASIFIDFFSIFLNTDASFFIILYFSLSPKYGNILSYILFFPLSFGLPFMFLEDR